jgi:hypothetical protein
MSTENHTPYEFDEQERTVVEEPVELFGGVLPLVFLLDP